MPCNRSRQSLISRLVKLCSPAACTAAGGAGMGCSWRPAALLALALLLPAAIAAAPIRGLDPALAPRYQPTADGKKFACLEGKKTIAFSQVGRGVLP